MRSLIKSFAPWLTSMGDYRDGVLMLGTGFYFFGYFVWAINASAHNLGVLSALDFQYFVAGIGPVLIIFLSILLVRGSNQLLNFVKEKAAGQLTMKDRVAIWTVFSLGMTGAAYILYNSSDSAWTNLLAGLLVVLSAMSYKLINIILEELYARSQPPH